MTESKTDLNSLVATLKEVKLRLETGQLCAPVKFDDLVKVIRYHGYTVHKIDPQTSHYICERDGAPPFSLVRPKPPEEFVAAVYLKEVFWNLAF